MHRCDFIIGRFYPVVWLEARCKIASNELGLRAAWRSKLPDEQASVFGSGEADLECPVVGLLVIGEMIAAIRHCLITVRFFSSDGEH